MPYLFILIAHILGDFTLQFDGLARAKDKKIRYLLLHVLIYMIPVSLVLILFGNATTVLVGIGIVSITHFIIDGLKRVISRRFNSVFYHNILFLLDQMLHIIILVTMTAIMFQGNALYDQWYGLLSGVFADKLEYYFAFLLALLITLSPSSILIKHILSYVDDEIGSNKVAQLNKLLNKCTIDSDRLILEEEINEIKRQNQDWDHEKDSNRTGSLIGKFERVIILILALSGLYASVGLVLAAKSLARFKQLEDKDFAEKYLIGTLLSVLITVTLVFLVGLFA